MTSNVKRGVSARLTGGETVLFNSICYNICELRYVHALENYKCVESR
jgi:hypothetical protein